MSALCVIPARGGSKRIPRKNIKNFCGKPIIAYSIEAALNSNCFDKVIVSTDDQEIADIAIKYGAEVPFFRSKELADDFTGTTEVIADSIKQLALLGDQYDCICCLYATASFVRIADLRDAFEALISHQVNYVFSVTEFASPIQRAIKLDSNNKVSMFDDNQFNERSQDLEKAYHDAGQFYWGKSQAWIDNRLIFDKGSLGWKIPRYQVQDIDTLEDWIQAELMFEVLKNGNKL